ncbi:Oxoglutarate and iron-dependent oxygenase degradation C-term-domain-containing protein [Amylocarpus encephaloides]|uniref:uS12 prolyl 3,4-dihydroxylase n=1 Tax=Amylocarpus encephaloides TaxID=45428 RepID=A0A9P7Y982_9HELO|nr:Oxoglutarate and iron-dependent oxygenase degradation C-term-domain-containing protein [Amylocarpus encephaloides]
MKRKAESQENGKSALKKRSKTILSEDDVRKSFRKGLFDKDILKSYTKEYKKSEPYKHSVINELIDDELLRAVRDEIRENVQFTPKETDIYKIHQSGDLANLDGLEDGALEKLPSLLRLRDAMYSSSFRKYVATITGSGELSGRKTDMAINIYTPGCHLLCHDDVIGSRRVSYILYLTHPDLPWKEEWGGALRLFPTQTFEDDTGEKTITPSPDFTKVIPPAWNQLSFFAVQPGESFHDVEEVYHAKNKEQLERDGGRIRMAISGWFHIPQIGEEGYVEGAEEKWGKNSSLLQLQGNPDQYDFPKSKPTTMPELEREETGFDEADLDFLLTYMAPTYLTPDTLEQVAAQFMETSSVTLGGLLSKKYSEKVRQYIEEEEKKTLPDSSTEIEKGPWQVAKPPHKHRFLYKQPNLMQKDKSQDLDPITELLEVFVPSTQFRKWLEITTQCDTTSQDLLARRFRKGLDYSLATSHDSDSRLEVTLSLTPTPGWGTDEDGEEEEEDEDADGSESEEDIPAEKANESKGKANNKVKGKERAKSKGKAKVHEQEKEVAEEDDVGGHEVYMAGDDDETDADAAIYKASSGEEDDNVLFTMPATWNKMSIVLRDSGVLKFVKYVSKNAKGDRWDLSGVFALKEEEEEEEDNSQEAVISLEDSEEEVFNGFPDSSDSDTE